MRTSNTSSALLWSFWLLALGAVQPSAATPRVGVCQALVLADVNSRSGESLGVVGIVAGVVSQTTANHDPSPTTKVELTMPPRHGKFVVIPPKRSGEWPDYRYIGDLGYEGKDTFGLAVHLPGGVVEAVYYTQVVRGDSAAASHCQKAFGKRAWLSE